MYCNEYIATNVLQQIYCNKCIATNILQQIYCNKYIATTLQQFMNGFKKQNGKFVLLCNPSNYHSALMQRLSSGIVRPCTLFLNKLF